MKLQIKKEYSFEKTGINEVQGLKVILQDAMKPLQDVLKEHVYWNDCDIEATEYKSRDGFIPYSENCGGMEISVIIPKCEEYDFSFLEFGECDECKDCKEDRCNDQDCYSENDGHLDAKLRVWLKFEGLDETGEMSFYLYCGGGNGDAPYFRTAHEQTVFEQSFTAKTLKQVEREAVKAVRNLINKLALK